MSRVAHLSGVSEYMEEISEDLGDMQGRLVCTPHVFCFTAV